MGNVNITAWTDYFAYKGRKLDVATADKLAKGETVKVKVSTDGTIAEASATETDTVTLYLQDGLNGKTEAAPLGLAFNGIEKEAARHRFTDADKGEEGADASVMDEKERSLLLVDVVKDCMEARHIPEAAARTIILDPSTEAAYLDYDQLKRDNQAAEAAMAGGLEELKAAPDASPAKVLNIKTAEQVTARAYASTLPAHLQQKAFGVEFSSPCIENSGDTPEQAANTRLAWAKTPQKVTLYLPTSASLLIAREETAPPSAATLPTEPGAEEPINVPMPGPISAEDAAKIFRERTNELPLFGSSASFSDASLEDRSEADELLQRFSATSQEVETDRSHFQHLQKNRTWQEFVELRKQGALILKDIQSRLTNATPAKRGPFLKDFEARLLAFNPTIENKDEYRSLIKASREARDNYDASLKLSANQAHSLPVKQKPTPITTSSPEERAFQNVGQVVRQHRQLATALANANQLFAQNNYAAAEKALGVPIDSLAPDHVLVKEKVALLSKLQVKKQQQESLAVIELNWFTNNSVLTSGYPHPKEKTPETNNDWVGWVPPSPPSEKTKPINPIQAPPPPTGTSVNIVDTAGAFVGPLRLTSRPQEEKTALPVIPAQTQGGTSPRAVEAHAPTSAEIARQLAFPGRTASSVNLGANLAAIQSAAKTRGPVPFKEKRNDRCAEIIDALVEFDPKKYGYLSDKRKPSLSDKELTGLEEETTKKMKEIIHDYGIKYDVNKGTFEAKPRRGVGFDPATLGGKIQALLDKVGFSSGDLESAATVKKGKDPKTRAQVIAGKLIRESRLVEEVNAKYDAALKKAPKLTGKVEIKFSINQSDGILSLSVGVAEESENKSSMAALAKTIKPVQYRYLPGSLPDIFAGQSQVIALVPTAPPPKFAGR